MKEKPYVEIIVFARSPVLGEVKQRLAREIGAKRALAVYRKLFRHTLRTVDAACTAQGGLRAVLSYFGPFPKRDIPRGLNVIERAQLHATMTENLACLFESPRCRSRQGILVLGADHPTMHKADILDLVTMLERFPVAVGPAEDGGFWGLAARVSLANIISTIALGCPETRAQLMTKLKDAGLETGVGRSLFDVDVPADMERWRSCR